MADRIIIWHIPTLPAITPTFYIDRDYEPVALRIYADVAPRAGDLLVDVLDDGVSIMNDNADPTISFNLADAYIEYSSQSAAFTVGETITGGTSGATARVESDRLGRLMLSNPSATAFTKGETITGGASASTATVDAYVPKVQTWTRGTTIAQSHAALAKGKNSEDVAQDFKPGVYIAEGSWLSMSLLDAVGAKGITIQLELDALAVNVGNRY